MALNGDSVQIVGNSREPLPGTPGIAAENETGSNLNRGLIALSAGLAVGVSGLGAALALGTAASAASAAITEKPETFGKLLVLLALIEAIAIYGFVIAFVLTGQM
ncbi:MAG: V-type ATP synthase subunit K [Candidatus Heimdallarchaeota archaeon]|nr:V-type ATP synthase subunit K [Candidatus Heimdallarchaeota archaeon]